MYNELFTRSFSKHEQKKLSLWAFVGCFVMALSFCALLNSYMGPLPLLNFQLSSSVDLKVFSIIDTLSDQGDVVVSMVNTSKLTPVKEVVQVEEAIDQVQEKDLTLKEVVQVEKAVDQVRVNNLTTKDCSQVEKAMDQVRVKKIASLSSLVCNFSLPKSNFCEIKGDVRIQGRSSAIIVSSSFEDNLKTSNISMWKLKPYARKIDEFVKQNVRELSIGSPSSFGLNEMPKCSINHTIPGIVFSSGGYAGNHFHDFSDILVPLYITSRPFNGEIQFIVTNIKPWWFIKYKAYIDMLSKYNIIDMDNSNEVHCFPSIIVGLKGHKEFGIDPSLTSQGYSMRSFTQFVRSAYSLKRSKVSPIRVGNTRKPRLLIISRKGSRSLVNEVEVATEARKLGYEVVIVDAMKNLRDFSKMVNSFDVMVGVHGAGLTNSIFLPENAILIQIIPLGLEWLSKHDFQLPAGAMNLRYLEYKISGKESSLADKYSLEDPLIRNPDSIQQQGWFAFKKLFLDGQHVKIDVAKFRSTLLKALELLRE